MKEYPAKHPPAMQPTHPGAILRETVLPALGLTVSEAARQLRVSRQTLHAILAERSAVTPEMAVRLGRFCGNGRSDEDFANRQCHGPGGVADAQSQQDVRRITVQLAGIVSAIVYLAVRQ